MRIAHVSTFWPNTLSVTAYTDNLLRGMAAAGRPRQYVLGEGHSGELETELYQSFPCFSRAEDYAAKIVDGARRVKADLVHLQYTNDVFGEDNRFPSTLRGLRDAGIKSVVTMHSTYPVTWRTRYRPGRTIGDFDRAMAEHADCLHVHTDRMRRDLLARGIPDDKIAVVGHGTPRGEQRDSIAARRELGIPEDARVVLFFGFIWPGKGIDFLISALGRARKRVPNLYFYVGGWTRHRTWYGQAYMHWIDLRLRANGMRARTRMYGDFVPEDKMASVFAAGDVVAFPYKQSYASVSGVVHDALGYDKLVLCSDIYKFEEIALGVDPGLIAPYGNAAAWAAGFERLLSDEPFIRQVRAKGAAFCAQTSWAQIGAQHVAVQDRIMGNRDRAVVAGSAR